MSTRALLVCGALGSLHVLLHLATLPLLTALAPFSPPLYGLIAGVHGVMPFLARRLTRTPGTATITAAIAGVIVAVTSPAGLMLIVPLLITGVAIDVVTWRVDRYAPDGRRVDIRFVLAAALIGCVLFLLSLTVFSPEHLTPLVLGCTLTMRVAGEILAATIATVVTRALRRGGIGGGTPLRTRINA